MREETENFLYGSVRRKIVVEDEQRSSQRLIQLINLSFSQVSSDDFSVKSQKGKSVLFSYQRLFFSRATAARQAEEIHRLLITFNRGNSIGRNVCLTVASSARSPFKRKTTRLSSKWLLFEMNK